MAKPQLKTCLSPALLSKFELKDTIVVVIDIFRATSTICVALANGAKSVLPIETVDECLDIERLKKDDTVTGGERQGVVIPGLQKGNSPLDYTADVIAGKILALTTTNGTRLLHKVKEADEILIGSFLNLTTITNYLQQKGKNVLLACAGWRDLVNLEDSLFAGAVAEKVKENFEINCDGTVAAQAMYHHALQHDSILDFLKQGTHYKRLSKYNLYEDLKYCCMIDLHSVLPRYEAPYLIKCNS